MARRIGDYSLSSLGEQDLAPFAFIGSVILGALGIFVSKYFAWPTWLVVAVPLSVMAAYLIASLKLPRLATRQDQIGDNVYYLGFLLTLVSLTVTLIQYSSDSANEYIISNFGVALAATIAGIAARSALSQFRKDTAGVERELQRELSKASYKLRGQIGAASEDFAALTRQISQVTDDYSKDIVTSHQALSSGLVKVLDEHTDSLTTSSAENTEKLERKVSDAIETIDTTSKGGADSIISASVTVTSAIDSVYKAFGDYLREHLESLNEIRSSELVDRKKQAEDFRSAVLTHEKALQNVSSLLENFQTAIANSQASLEADRAANAKEFDSRLQGLVDAMSKANADAITGARLNTFLDAFQETARAMGESARAISTSIVSSQEVLKQQNETFQQKMVQQRQEIESVIALVSGSTETLSDMSLEATQTLEKLNLEVSKLASQLKSPSTSDESAVTSRMTEAE